MHSKIEKICTYKYGNHLNWAGKAVTKVIPSLKNKLTANAIKVPTPNGSLAIINLDLKINIVFMK